MLGATNGTASNLSIAMCLWRLGSIPRLQVICVQVAIVDTSVPDLLLSFGGQSCPELGIGKLRESMLSNDSA